MNLKRASFLALAVLVTAACRDDKSGVTDIQPEAAIRYVNAVPDTLPMDFHAVDIVENSPYIGTAFREIKQAGYTRAKAGDRHFRAFPASTDINTTSKVLADATVNLLPNAYYTILHVGYARNGQAPAQQLILRPDTLPTVPAGQIAVRVVHVGIGLPNVDVYSTATPTTAVSGAPVVSNLAYLGASPYVNFPVASTRAIRLMSAGTTTALASVAIQPGDTAQVGLDPIPGTKISGSIFTVYLFPRSVAGSTAPQTTTGVSFAAPAAVFTPDAPVRRP